MLAAGVSEVRAVLLAIGRRSEVDAAPFVRADGLWPARPADPSASIVTALALPASRHACNVAAVRGLFRRRAASGRKDAQVGEEAEEPTPDGLGP